jgi:hypothetical protein
VNEWSRNELKRYTLTPDQFKAILQLSREVLNFQETRLQSVGCGVAGHTDLLTKLGEVESQIGATSCVRVIVSARSSPSGTSVATSDPDTLDLRMSGSTAASWLNGIRLVLSAMSPRELFLRTGFSMEELSGAASALAPSQTSDRQDEG